mgnify:FL=1
MYMVDTITPPYPFSDQMGISGDDILSDRSPDRAEELREQSQDFINRYEAEVRDAIHGSSDSANSTVYAQITRNPEGRRNELFMTRLTNVRAFVASGCGGACVTENDTQNLFNKVQNTVGNWINTGREFVTDTYTDIRDGLTSIYNRAGSFFNQARDFVSDNVTDPLRQRIEDTGDFLRNAPGNIADRAGNFYEGSWLQRSVQNVRNTLNGDRENTPDNESPGNEAGADDPEMSNLFSRPIAHVRNFFSRAASPDQDQPDGPAPDSAPAVNNGDGPETHAQTLG